MVAAKDGKPSATALGHSGGVEDKRWRTGIDQADLVLGGGLVPGAVVLLAGEPGIGKSTLLLQLLDSLHRCGRRVLLATGEESLGQVALRARRLRVAPELRAVATTSLQTIHTLVEEEKADVLVVDSVQTTSSVDVDGSPGSAAQLRECASALVRLGKERTVAVILVGHVTKEGSIAGPKMLEHMVDAVVSLEGERGGALRLLRAVKNRFGSCDETGVFVMGERGLEGVDDASALFLADRRQEVAGSAVFPSLEGSRPLLVEIQALTASATPGQTRRVVNGLDARRLALLIAVLERHAATALATLDVFVACAGGLQVKEPAADVAICLALHSAAAGLPLPPGLVAIGEVGLGGEVRRAHGIERRLREAARLGFDTALVPRGVGRCPRGIRAVEIADITQALQCTRAARAVAS